MDFRNNQRILKNLGIPANRKESDFSCLWRRADDFFDDKFTLRADVSETSMVFSWEWTPAGSKDEPTTIWTMEFGQTEKGRTKISKSEGITPQVASIERASEIIKQAIEHAKATPKLVFDKPLAPTKSPSKPAI